MMPLWCSDTRCTAATEAHVTQGLLSHRWLFRICVLTVLLTVLLIALIGVDATPGLAQQDQPGTGVSGTAGDSGGTLVTAENVQVRRVKVNFFINSIHALNDEVGSYEVDFWLDLYWRDPALDGKTVDEVDPATLWNPSVDALNSTNLTQLYESYADSFEPDTNVYLSQRLVGTFTSAFDLRRFPFDQQRLEVQLESNEFDSNRLLFDFLGADQEVIYAEQPFTFPLPIGKYISPEFALPSWSITAADVVQQIHVLPYDKSSWAQFRIEIQVARSSRSYVLKIMLVFVLLMILGATVFAINLTELRYRLLSLFTLLLTAVIFDFTRLQVSPHAPYLTLLDLQALATYFTLGVAAGTVVLIAVQEKRAGRTQAERLNLFVISGYCLFVLVVNVGLGWYGIAG
ncbi:MAG: hypothetical protein KDE19_22525 [Caldilineaceae bacterium]|nr:hypothetical protein [Caldilineaceae bacterium]